MWLITLVGIISGFIMGIIGIGGGAILVPLLLLTGIGLQEAVAIVLITQVIPQTLPAIILYYKKNIFPWKKGVIVTIGSLIGVTLGAYIATKGIVSQKTLYRATSIALILLGIIVWWKYS